MIPKHTTELKKTHVHLHGTKFNFSSTNHKTFDAFTRRTKPSAGIFKLLRSPAIDSMESLPSAYVARQAGTTTLFQLGS
jgi:hypothetical protein